MTKTTKILALVLALVMAFGLVACSSSSSDTTASTTTSTSNGREDEVNQVANETTRDTATDRTLVFGIQEYSIGIDPAQEINTAWNCSRYGMGECLFRFDNAMNVVNWLCDDYNVNEEHTVWEFHIREGVKFSDGCELTAEAVKASFDRLFRDAVGGSSKPDTFVPAGTEITADNATGVVTFVTPAPVVALQKNLCHPVTTIIDVEHTTDYVGAAICTGPYAASKFVEHVGMTVVRNEYYWNGEVPYASIELVFMGDASAKAMALQADQVDLVENITNIADLQNFRNDPAYTVTVGPGVRTGICHFNVGEGKLLSNDVLRHAVIKAVDRETMCEITVGGLHTAGFSVLPSNLDYGYSNLNEVDPFDPDEAMRTMDEAGIVDTDGDGIREMPDGTPVMLKYVTYPNRCLDTFAEAVQQQLAEVGIGVDLVISDGAGQWDSYQSGEFDINSSNWSTVATGEPNEYMNAWWSTCSGAYCNYVNAEYDELFAELEECMNEGRRKEIIERLQQILIDDAACMPLGYYNSSMISRNAAIGGAAINTADYYWVTPNIYPAG